MKESEIIKEIMDLYQAPQNWVKCYRAMDPYGYPVQPSDERAVSWCLGGAAVRVIGDRYEAERVWYPGQSTLGDRFHRMARERGYDWASYPFVEFNNDPDTTFEDLLLFLKEALVSAEIEEAEAAIKENLAPVEGAGF